jgi:hypothetical protein
LTPESAIVDRCRSALPVFDKRVVSGDAAVPIALTGKVSVAGLMAAAGTPVTFGLAMNAAMSASSAFENRPVYSVPMLPRFAPMA